VTHFEGEWHSEPRHCGRRIIDLQIARESQGRDDTLAVF